MIRLLLPTSILRAVVLALALGALAPPVAAQIPLSIGVADASGAVNGLRSASGLASVTPDPVLMALASQQALAMASANTLSHSVAGTLQARLAANGYGNLAAAENIAYGQPSLDAVFATWMQSAPHRSNILNRQMTRFGFGAATVNGVTFWALIFTAG